MSDLTDEPDHPGGPKGRGSDAHGSMSIDGQSLNHESKSSQASPPGGTSESGQKKKRKVNHGV